jgi:hypothetical protein
MTPEGLKKTAAAERIMETPNRLVLQDFWVAKGAGFRQRPEALQLFRDLELPAYWDLYGWPSVCRRTDVHNFACD